MAPRADPLVVEERSEEPLLNDEGAAPASETARKSKKWSSAQRLRLVGGLNLAYAALQIFGALGFNALGLLSDGFHNLSDVGAVACALLALKYGKMAPSAQFPFGTKRASLLGGLVNGVALVAMCAFVALEACARLLRPEATEAGWALTLVAAAGIFVNLVSAGILALADDPDAMPVCAHSHGHHGHGGHGCSHGHGHGHGHAKGAGHSAGAQGCGHGHDHGHSHGHSHGHRHEAHTLSKVAPCGHTHHDLGAHGRRDHAHGHGCHRVHAHEHGAAASCSGKVRHDADGDDGDDVELGVRHAEDHICGGDDFCGSCAPAPDIESRGHTAHAHGHHHIHGESCGHSHQHSHGAACGHGHHQDDADHRSGHHPVDAAAGPPPPAPSTAGKAKASDEDGAKKPASSFAGVSKDANLYAVLLHSLSDALTSCVVLIEAIVLQNLGPTGFWAENLRVYLDPVLSILMAAVIAYSVKDFVSTCLTQLLDAVPPGIDAPGIQRALEELHPAVTRVAFLGVRASNVGPVRPGEAVGIVRLGVDPSLVSSVTMADDIARRAKVVLVGSGIDEAFIDLVYSD